MKYALIAAALTGRPHLGRGRCRIDYALQAGAQGLLEPLDYTVIDRSKLDPRFVSDHAAGSFYHSFMLGSNPSAFPEAPKLLSVAASQCRTLSVGSCEETGHLSTEFCDAASAKA